MISVRNSIEDRFQVSASVRNLSACVMRFPRLWQWLGDVETSALSKVLEPIEIVKPIYICGLARSGSTILLEALAQHRHVATHQYRDFPFLDTPVWWSRTCNSHAKYAATERAHADGLKVTPRSPEAMEEVLWQRFFPHAHDSRVTNILDQHTQHPSFERFYRDHIRKLLHARGKPRYAAKSNYCFSRIEYLRKLFSDVRIVIPIRHPVAHIASLMKQHDLFVRGTTKYPAALTHLRRVGHYEFGIDRRPINVGNSATIQEIEDLWGDGEEVRAWARYWASLYGWLWDRLKDNSSLRDAVLIVPYEQLCAKPHDVLARIESHTGLPPQVSCSPFADSIKAPTYYEPKFNSREREIIHEETKMIAERFGYATTARIPDGKTYDAIESSATCSR